MLICVHHFTAKNQNIIAVTGTNGKTSVTDFCRQLWNFYGLRSASVGTLGIKYSTQNLS